MARKVSINCPALGEIDLPLGGSRIINFSPSWKGNGVIKGGSVLSTPCPCCEFSHFSPINEEQKARLLGFGVQVTNVNLFGQANVPKTKRINFRNGEHVDLEKIIKKDIKVLYGSSHKRLGKNAKDHLASTIDRWADQYSFRIGRSMQQRTTPMSWRSIDSG